MYITICITRIKNNFEIVKLAIQNSGYALNYASPDLQNNIKIIRLATEN